MGVKDNIITPYFEDSTVFCDFINGAVFKGKQVLRPENIEQLPRELIMQLPWETDGRSNQKTLIRDTVKQAYFHTMYVIFICENQSEVHYGMPVRMLLYDSVQYGEQMKKRQRENKKTGDLKASAEFLSGLHKGEKLMPVVSVVFYYGDSPWDGPLSMEEMILLPDDTAELKEYLPEYKVHLIDARNTDPDKFSGDWKVILETLRCGNCKDDLIRYVESHEKELEELSAKASRALLTMLGRDIKAEKDKEEFTMCRALEELKEEAKMEEEIHVIRKLLKNELTPAAISHWLDMDKAYIDRIVELQNQYPDYSNAQILAEYEVSNAK